MGRLPPFAGAILTAMAFYWLSYVVTQLLANFVLAMEGIELRFIAPLSAEFGVIAVVFVSMKTTSEICRLPHGREWRKVALRLAAGLLSVFLSTYLLVRVGGLQLNQFLIWDEAATMALLFSVIYLLFTGLLLFLDRFVGRPGA